MTLKFNDDEPQKKTRVRKKPFRGFAIDPKTHNMLNRLAKHMSRTRSAIVSAAIHAVYAEEFGDEK